MVKLICRSFSRRSTIVFLSRPEEDDGRLSLFRFAPVTLRNELRVGDVWC